MAFRIFNEYEKAYHNLEVVAYTMTRMSPDKCLYQVENTYFDFGADLAWTTIVCHYHYVEDWGEGDSSYQCLAPYQHDTILNAKSDIECEQLAVDIMEMSMKYYPTIHH